MADALSRLLSHPRLPVLLGALVAVRLLLDLAWVPLPLGQVATVLLGVVAGVVALAPTGPAWQHPLRMPVMLLGGWSVLVGIRGLDPEALRHGLHLWLPLLWLLAAPRADPRWPRGLLVAGLVPIAASLVHLALGQPAEHVLHDLPRLHGAYRNLHGHAVAMAALVVVGGWTALEDQGRWRLLGAVVAGLAGVCLAATWVRTLLVFVVLALGTVMVLGRWWRTLGGGAALGLGGLALSPGWQGRFADVARVLSGTPPPEGWGAVGSWRGRIWVESWQGWLDGPAHTWFIGRGLGGHVGLHRHLDPHHEYLSLLFQLGPVGLLAWLGLAVGALVLCVRARSPAGRLGAGLLVAVLLTNALSNEWLTRATLQWVTWGAVGLALATPASSACPAGDATAPRRRA